MPTALPELLRDLARASAAGDAERIASVRRTIADAHPETDAGAEASFRLGLGVLFSGGDLDEAENRLRAAAKAKSKLWSPEARISLGILLARRGKLQQAVFELRKVAGASPPTLAAASALGWMRVVQADAGQPADAEKSRTLQLAALEKLVGDKEPATAALAHYLLGLELKHEGQRAGARAHLEKAIASQRLGSEDLAAAKRALEGL